MRRSLPLVVAALCVAPIFVAQSARAQWSNAQSLYTEDGVELAVDGRVFALFAMWNALGFDDDSLRGPAPIHKPLHTDARQKARGNLGRPGPGLKAFEAALQKNPVERSAYVAAVLELGPAPNFEDKNASPLAKAIAGPMRDWFNEEGGAQVLRIVGDAAKPLQKKLLPVLDKSIKETTTLVRLGDAQDQLLDDSGAVGRVVLVLNELDGHGGAQRVSRGDLTYVVVGPPANDADERAIVNAVVGAYARTLVVREAAKGVKPGNLADVALLGADAKATVVDQKGYATELLACGFLRQVRGKDAACVGSPVAQEPAALAALDALAPRIEAFAKDTAVLGASVEKLLEPAASAPAATDATADKAKKSKPAGKGG